MAAQPATAKGLRLPLRFERNIGQANARFRFFARSGRALIGLHERGVHLAYSSAPAGTSGSKSATVGWEFAGGEPTALVPEGAVESQTHYFRSGNERPLSPASFRAVRQRHVYRGIDVVYYSDHDGFLEHDFEVHPGADPASIRLHFRGADSLRITEAGDLAFGIAGDELQLKRPVAYQQDGAERHEVTATYVVHGDVVGIRVAEWDHSLPLIIDPVLAYSTLLGGASFDSPQATVADASGSLYILGVTQSADFPATYGSISNGAAVFVTKLNSTGTAVVYSALFPGVGSVVGAAVDASGQITFAGDAGLGWPTTAGALKVTGVGWFVTKLNQFGNGLVFSTYINDVKIGSLHAMTVDSAGNAVLAGEAGFYDPGLTTVGAYQTIRTNILTEGIIVKLNSTGTALVFATYYGGAGSDGVLSVGTDSSNNVIVLGYTDSDDLPVTGTQVASNTPGNQPFAARFSANGASLQYATLLPYDSYPTSFAADSGGNMYTVDHNARKITPAGAVSYTRAVSPNGANHPVVNAAGVLYLFDSVSNVAGVYKISADGTTETLVGPILGDFFTLDSAGGLYFVGSTLNPAFPVTQGAFQTTLNGPQDMFAMKYTEGSSSASLYLTPTTADFGSIPLTVASLDTVFVLTNTGGTAVTISNIAVTTDFVIHSKTCGSSLAAFSSCTINVYFFPTAPVVRSGALTITSNASGSPHTAALAGVGTGPRLTASPNPIDFGATTVSTTRNLTVTLNNIGNTAGNLGTITSTSAVFAVTNRGTCPAEGGTIAALNSCTIQVGFTPTATGSVGGTLQIRSSGQSGFYLDVPLYGVGGDTASVTPDPLDFGDQILNTYNDKFITIRNNTTQNMTLYVLGSTDNVQFLVQSGSSCTVNTVLGPAQSCPVGIRFYPQGSGGNKTASFSLRYTLSNNPGTFVDKVTTMQGKGIYPIQLNPLGLVFASTPTNQYSYLSVLATNVSDSALPYTSPTVPNYAYDLASCVNPLPAKTSCNFRVRFGPTTTGTLTTTLSLNSATGSPISFSVPLSVTGTGVSPALTLSPSQVQQLTGVVLGSAGAAQTVTVYNGTINAVTLSGFSVQNAAGSDPPYWQISATTCGATLTSGATCTVSVKNTPVITGYTQSSLRVQHSGVGSPQSVQLVGFGIYPNVYFQPSQLDFGATLLGTSKSATVTITNKSAGTITISSVTASAGFIRTTTCGSSLASLASCSATISFTPASSGLVTGTLTVTSSAGGSPHSLPLQGTGSTIPLTPGRPPRPPRP